MQSLASFFLLHTLRACFFGGIVFYRRCINAGPSTGSGTALAQHLPIIRFNPYGVFFLDKLSDLLNRFTDSPIHRFIGAKQRFATLYSYHPTAITNAVVGVVNNAILTRGNALNFIFRFNQIRVSVFV